ncbi:MAG TPA: AAA family ATPase [Candidatus Obscuribacterales bacterium]
MAKQNTTTTFVPGSSIVVYWEANRASKSPNAVKSNKTDSGKTKKIILPVSDAQGPQPRPGEVWLCRIEKVTSRSETHGAIFVRPVSRKLEYHFEGVWIDPVKAQLSATVLQDPRRNLMFEGDQGVGKSTIAHAIAKTLGWEYRKVSGGLIKKFVFMLGRYVPSSDGTPIAVDSLSADLLKRLGDFDMTDEGGTLGFGSSSNQALFTLLVRHVLASGGRSLTFKWMDSKLVEVLREARENPHKTFLLMIDEFSRIDEDARDALLDVIEGNSRFLRLPTGEEIPVSKNIVFMSAGNVGEGFTVKREDAAAKDRWVIIKINVMPQPEELAHCMRLYPTCPKDELDLALTIVNKVREARKDTKMRLSKTVSTRGAETIAMFLAAGFGIDVALETAVVNQYSGTADNGASEAGRVARLIKDELEKKK